MFAIILQVLKANRTVGCDILSKESSDRVTTVDAPEPYVKLDDVAAAATTADDDNDKAPPSVIIIAPRVTNQFDD